MANANSTAKPGNGPAINALPAEDRIAALQEESAVLAEDVERLERFDKISPDFNPFEFAMAFQHIEGLADTLLLQAPRQYGDLAFSIMTIAQHYGAKMQGMSEEFGGSMPVVEGGAA